MRITDKQLTKISLLTSTLGLLIIIGIYIQAEPQSITIDEAQRLEEHEEARITGTITQAQERGSITLLEIESTCALQAVSYEPITLKEGEQLTISGTMDTYKGQKQLVIKEIRR